MMPRVPGPVTKPRSERFAKLLFGSSVWEAAREKPGGRLRQRNIGQYPFRRCGKSALWDRAAGENTARRARIIGGVAGGCGIRFIIDNWVGQPIRKRLRPI